MRGVRSCPMISHDKPGLGQDGICVTLADTWGDLMGPSRLFAGRAMPLPTLCLHSPWSGTKTHSGPSVFLNKKKAEGDEA